MSQLPSEFWQDAEQGLSHRDPAKPQDSEGFYNFVHQRQSAIQPSLRLEDLNSDNRETMYFKAKFLKTQNHFWMSVTDKRSRIQYIF